MPLVFWKKLAVKVSQCLRRETLSSRLPGIVSGRVVEDFSPDETPQRSLEVGDCHFMEVLFTDDDETTGLNLQRFKQWRERWHCCIVDLTACCKQGHWK